LDLQLDEITCFGVFVEKDRAVILQCLKANAKSLAQNWSHEQKMY
jgi:hypothetical protein